MRQILVITLMNLRTIGSRKGASLVAAIGFAGVVLVLVAVLAMAQGFRATLAQAGSDDVAIVVRAGSTEEMSSSLSPEAVAIVRNAPGIAQLGDRPLLAAELFVTVDLPKRSTGTWANVPFRGTSELGPRLRPHFKLVEGRMFTPGRDEVIVGAGAARAFAGLAVGDTIKSGNAQWRVVGRFTDGGSITESEVWTDARGLQSAYNRGTSFQTVRAKLTSSSALRRFADALTTDRRLNVTVKSEREFLAAQATTLAGIIRTAGVLIGLLMGVGAVFGALNTMYSAVAARAREIATLQALGFGSAPIIVSVLVEGTLLALLGGLIGGALAYLAFNGFEASTLNYSTFSQVTFAFAVTPSLMATGIGYALLLGLLGGMLPAIRAVRLPIVQGLRAV